MPRELRQDSTMDAVISRIVTNLEAQLPISVSILRDLEALLDYALKTNDLIDIENFYNELSSRNLPLSSLTNAVSSAMDSGLSSNSSILASKIYLSILLLPNSPVFSLFTPMSFLTLLRAVRMAIKNPSSASRDGSVSRSPPGKKKKGRRALGGNKNKAGSSDTMRKEGIDEGYDVKDLFFLLDKLINVMGLIHLDRFPDCLKALVQTICQIPMTAVEFLGDVGSFRSLCELCSQVLTESLKREHGNQADTAAEVLKTLAPSILLSRSQVRIFGLGFVVNNMVGMGESSIEIKNAVVNMPKYLAQKAPEKAEPRALAVESIMDIVKAVDSESQVGFANYVLKMSQGKGHLRLLSVDLIPALIMSSRVPFAFNTPGEVENSWCFNLLEALVKRCSDSTAGIRARALTNLGHIVVFMSSNDRARSMLKEVMGFGRDGNHQINKILKQRCVDEKAVVRKAALLLISKLTGLLGGEPDEELIKTTGMACSDPLVSIRKVGISALSEAFRTSSNPFVRKEWLHSVPRLISDNETSIQEECESLFLELVLNRVSDMGLKISADDGSIHHDMNSRKYSFSTEAEELLGLLKEICDGEVSSWVKKICLSLGKKKKLQSKLATAVQNIIKTSESQWLKQSQSIEKWTAPPGAWFLLSEISAFLSKAVDWEFLCHHWQLLDKYNIDNNLEIPSEQSCRDTEMVDEQSSSVAWVQDRVFLLQTISNVSTELPPELAAGLAQSFLKRLEGFNMHSTEVNAHVKALKTVCRQKAFNAEEADSLVMRWVNQLHNKASQALESSLSKLSDANGRNTLFTPPTTGGRKETRRAQTNSKLVAKATSAIYTVGSIAIICTSANLQAIVPALHTIITSGSSCPGSGKLLGAAVPMKQIAPSLYINAWLTMGKICLADGKLAKRYLPLFVQELEKSDSAAVRNNMIVIMADFCIRYTAMVDCYMPKITKCLRDPCELVRRQTFILLSRLLQRDYVKWRGLLFLRFLLCLVDDSEKIRQLADFLFGTILKAKAPLLAYNTFVEAIYFLNDCNTHTGKGNSDASRNENRSFSIRGNDERARSQRMHIYATLLKQMAQEHLLATFAKVCAEILAAASDGMLSLDDIAGQSVVQDAFLLLSSKEIRIQANHGPSSDSADAEEDAGDGGGLPTIASRGRAITQAVRKGLIQNSIPIFIELKRLLESKNSPLIGSLMDCLRILLKDYKNEIDDMLVADRDLQKELIHDMQKYEAMKAKNTAATIHRQGYNYTSPYVRNKGKLPENIQHNSKVASAVADAAAFATARSVLREVNRGVSTPLGSMSVPKLKSVTGRPQGEVTGAERPAEVIESLRRRQFFDSDEEN